jgi:hypothetical protein
MSVEERIKLAREVENEVTYVLKRAMRAWRDVSEVLPAPLSESAMQRAGVYSRCLSTLTNGGEE